MHRHETIVGAGRRRAVGAELTEDGVDVRVWAPDRHSVSIVIDGRDLPLDCERNGYFRGVVRDGSAGTRYRFRLDGESETFPDPASRFQPEGPHGPSCVVDAATFAWHDASWRGPDADRLVIYEMHVGTFTREGTWRAASALLPYLRDLGITMIEMMPVNDFPGAFGWGYDGVDLWAPTRLYGEPDDLRAFVDAAHQHDIAVILDVVYNHLGPDGCYLSKYTKKYFTDRYKCEWGDALNFDGDGCEGVREFFIENAAYWSHEFHFEGLRLDATQSIFDASREHVLQAITTKAREVARGRRTFVVGENEPQETMLIDRYGLDALWNDDWHHSALVAATGQREAYYTDYGGAPQEFVSMAKFGFLYQGQRYAWQRKRRGTSSIGIPPRKLVCYTQNHDQIANTAYGARLHDITSPGRFRALTALLLLGPNTPMLFQGQEFAASAPFLYFADHSGDLASAVSRGRRKFLSQFRSIKEIAGEVPTPNDRATFERCKLAPGGPMSPGQQQTLELHRDLLQLRREDDAFRGRVEGAVIGPEAFILRFINEGANDRLLVVNLGRELRLEILPEPLLAPPRGSSWSVMWSSNAPQYGGSGTAAIETHDGWDLPAETAAVLSPTEHALSDPDRER